MNHFANVCQGGGFRKSSKPVHTLRSEADTEGTGDDGQLFVGTLFIGDIQANDWQTKLRVNDTPVTFKLDTGAQANDWQTKLRVNDTPVTFKLDTGAQASNDWQTKLRVNDTPVTFKLDTGAQANVLPVNVYRRIQPNKPLARTRTVLTAFGDAKITPVGETQLRATCPVSGRSQLERDGIIASVDEPTDWVHNLVITEKRNGSLRICLDPRPLNKAIKRERCEIPTPADVQSQLVTSRSSL